MTGLIEQHLAKREEPVHYGDVEDQIERWIARLEAALDRTDARMAEHERIPWHVGFSPVASEHERRLERLELAAVKGLVVVCGLLASIAGLLIWILFIAEKIASSKPPIP